MNQIIPAFERINAEDMLYVVAISRRAESIARRFHLLQKGSRPDTVFESNFEIVSLDIAIVFLQRKLKLRDFLFSDDLTFQAEFTTIQKYIIRPGNFFPFHVKLRFAQIGATTLTS